MYVCVSEFLFEVMFERSKTHKRLNERFFIGQNRTKHATFWGSPLFQASYNIKTEKQTINSTYLVSVGCGRLAEGKGHETVFMLYVAWKKGLPWKFACFALFRPIKKHCFYLLCVLDLFFRMLAVNSVSDFCCCCCDVSKHGDLIFTMLKKQTNKQKIMPHACTLI